MLSIGIFFSLMIAGLAGALTHGLTAQGVPAADAARVAALPPVGVLFASLLGYNPVQTLLGPHALAQLPAGHADYLTGRAFFPALISPAVLRRPLRRLRLRDRRLPGRGLRLAAPGRTLYPR
ncbi:hypothetical protein [Streptomyces scopuliridis]|uniref:hypothetical protein n=1 Tax=Streptomyces scopuliridis TaxID=452529 RepID=UPI00398CD78B